MSDSFPLRKPIRHRSPDHLAYVRTFRCSVCELRPPSNAHHLTIAQPKARGLKSGDQFAVPLCDFHHRQLHDRGDERAWWEQFGIDPMKLAEDFWNQSPGRLDEQEPPLRRRKLKTRVVRKNRRA